MRNTIKFKQYHNDDRYSFDELPQFIVDTEEDNYSNTSFKGKLLYFHIHNKDINPFTKKEEDEIGNSYFKLTIKDIQELLDVTENTARKYKNELVDKKLIFEIPKRGRKAARYAINRDLDLKKKNSTYVNKNGEKRFTFIKVPQFLSHSHFDNHEQHDPFIYSLIRHRINLSIDDARTGSRKYVANNGNIFCRFTIDDLAKKLNLNAKLIKAARNRLIANRLLKEDETYNKDAQVSSIKFFVSEPIALPVEDKKMDKKPKYTFGSKLPEDAFILYRKNPNQAEEKALTMNEIDLSNNKNQFNPQNMPTNELELRELVTELINKHMKHMFKDQSVSIVQHSSNVIDLTTKANRTRKYPEALAAHINKYSEKDINSFCDVINKGKDNRNDKLKTNYTIEDVERALIEAIQNTVKISKKESRNQKQKESYLMGAVKKIFDQHHKKETQPNESSNNVVSNRNTAKRHQSREMTPQWIFERDQPKEEKMTPEEQLEHDKKEAKFRQHLKERWDDDETKCAN